MLERSLQHESKTCHCEGEEIWRAGTDGRTQGIRVKSEAEKRLLWATAIERLWWSWLLSTAGSLFIHHSISTLQQLFKRKKKKKYREKTQLECDSCRTGVAQRNLSIYN